jgi:hypothetical protein
MLSYRSFVILSVVVVSSSVLAQRTATVLPQNIFRVRAVGVVAQPVNQRLNSEGQAQGLMSPLERTLTTQDLAATSPALNELYTGLNSFESGLGDSLMSVDFLPMAQMNARQAIMAAEYGVTSRLSLGIIVPTVSMDVKASFDARVSNQVSRIAERTRGVQVLEDGLRQFEGQMPTSQFFVNEVFTKNGYDVPQDFSYTGLGDIELGAKYQYLKMDTVRGSVLGGLRMPTATHKARMENLLDRSTGDGQWDLAFEVASEWDPIKPITLGLASRYTLQLPNTERRALLRDGQSGLPNLNDPQTVREVRRNLGDVIDGEVSAKYTFLSAWSLIGLYGVSYKAQDRYTGPEGYQISALEENTASSDSRYELGLNYSTIPAFARNAFPVPLEMKLSYNSLIAGTNTPRSAYARMDFIVYF